MKMNIIKCVVLLFSASKTRQVHNYAQKQNASANNITTCPKRFFIFIIFENYNNKNYACFKIRMCRVLFHHFHKPDSEVCVLTRHSTEHLKPVLYDH